MSTLPRLTRGFYEGIKFEVQLFPSGKVFQQAAVITKRQVGDVVYGLVVGCVR